MKLSHRIHRWRERLADRIAPPRTPLSAFSLRVWPNEIVVEFGKPEEPYNHWSVRIPRPDAQMQDVSVVFD